MQTYVRVWSDLGEDGNTPTWHGENVLYVPKAYPGHIKWGWCILNKEAVAGKAAVAAVDEELDSNGDVVTPAVAAVPEVVAKDKTYDCLMQSIDVDATGEQNFDDDQFGPLEDWSYSGTIAIDNLWGDDKLVKDADDK